MGRANSLIRALLFSIAMVVMPATSCAPIARAQQVDEDRVRKVKAAYLYNFTKFVRWPARAFKDLDDPVIIGILGSDPFGRVLDKSVAGKSVGGRRVVIRRFRSINTVDVAELRRCHILYISPLVSNRLPAIFAWLKGSNVLTVGDGSAFAERGGAIGFAIEKGKIVFYANRKAAKQAGLKLSAQLLKLAKLVKARR